MRWASCAWLLVVGCFDPPTGPPYKVHLLSADPPIIAVHGGDIVTVQYEGDVLANVGVAIDGVGVQPTTIDPLGRTFTFSAPAHDRGPVGLSLFNLDRGRQIAFNDDLLSYDVMPAKPVMVLSAFAQESLAWRLHPELSRECARGGDVFLENLGDLPLTLNAVSSSSDDFAFSWSQCPTLDYGDYCRLGICFTSPIPGSPQATLTASTDSGNALLNVWANVTQPLTGLDPTFHGGGLVYDTGNDQYGGVGVVVPSGIVTWAGRRVIGIDLVGTETHRDIVAMIGSLPADWIVAMRASPTGGVYALVANTSQRHYATLIHLDDALVPNVQIDLPVDVGNPYYDLQVQPSGRVLAIGLRGVVAMASGALDTTYGSSGITIFPGNYANRSALDSQGRLYATVNNALVRITANGLIDGSFSYSLNPTAITIDAADHVHVLVGNRLVQLSESGAETLEISNAPFANDLDIDASGRFYFVSGGGFVQRYTNGALEGMLGYDDTSSVACPPSGACYLLGVGVLPSSKPFSTGVPDYLEKYVLRLAN